MLLSQRQVKYVEDIIVTIDTTNLDMSRRELIQTMSDIGHACSYVQADNHLDYLVLEKWPPKMKRHGRVINSQATTTELSQICGSQQYC